MMHIQEFGSIDEAFAAIRQATHEANTRLAEAQRGLSWGDYFVNFEPVARVVIFGYCMTEDEVGKAEMQAGATRAEADETMRVMRRSHADGYLFGWHYSVIEPLGELGSAHRGNVWPISKGLFEAAREAGWRSRRLPPEHMRELYKTYQAMRSHYLGIPDDG